ncbi:hypothetical protein HHK36_032474 [Tetracentron sinense]|uniref:HMA domain-containing protein n=1 Tax=Tetracentron sinense TaxID=13715 RepID=A0A834Y507_TETSI|nr:hypothetical protein HHK36_032474 [Tetracentron sinense]
MTEKVSTLVLKVDLDCHCCYKKIKKVLCMFHEIRDQKFDEKNNTVTITGPFCPQKMTKKLCCKAGKTIKCIEEKKPETTPANKPDPPAKPVPKPEPVIVVPYPVGVYCGPCYTGCGIPPPCYDGCGSKPPPCYDGCGRKGSVCRCYTGCGIPPPCYDGCSPFIAATTPPVALSISTISATDPSQHQSRDLFSPAIFRTKDVRLRVWFSGDDFFSASPNPSMYQLRSSHPVNSITVASVSIPETLGGS